MSSTNGAKNTMEWENFIVSFQKPGKGVDEYGKPGNITDYKAAAVALEYRGPCYAADMLTAVTHDRENAFVLDVAAGTGFVGQELHKRGYRNLVAHDGSFEMVEACKQTGVYKDHIVCLIGDGHRLPVDDNSYDSVVCSGATLEYHLPDNSQDEIIRVIKPGGFFVNSYRATIGECEYGKDWFKQANRLEADGKWELYGRLHFSKYSLCSDGCVDIYRIL